MRKITRQIKKAFERREAKTVGNTTTDGDSVWIHGNKIVQRKDGVVMGSLAGWNTPTTRERVNGITGLGFYQKNFEPMLNGRIIDPND
ncbi:MAG: hypothetical protein DWQ49_09430 [Bacteroidetes bacterium]|nr:MAG: hypothetical protein DWQ49_09430 [Bacteroidota bacterium]